MKYPSHFRKEYGECLVTILSDDVLIPWRVLTVGEYRRFLEMQQGGLYPMPFIEDEIFKLCVLDERMVKDADHFPAGVITSVAKDIWAASFPSSLPDLQFALEQERMKYMGNTEDQLASIVLRAFPSYKLSDIREMPFNELMRLVVMAEEQLLNKGVLAQPLQLSTQQAEQTARPERAAVQQRSLNGDYQPVSQRQAPQQHKVIRKDQYEGIPSNNPQERQNMLHDVMDGLDLIYPELLEHYYEHGSVSPEDINRFRGESKEDVRQKQAAYARKLETGEMTVRDSDKRMFAGHELEHRAAALREQKRKSKPVRISMTKKTTQ